MSPEPGVTNAETIAAADYPDPPTSTDSEESFESALPVEPGMAIETTPKPVTEPSEPVAGTLPSIDELVNRLPETVRTTLEELFRVKFTGVRRVPKAVLKS